MERWKSLDPDKTPIAGAPEIAIEVISPSERAGDTMRKVLRYFGAGTREAWQFYPEGQRVSGYRDSRSSIILGIGDTLSTPLLPGWEITVREVFEIC